MKPSTIPSEAASAQVRPRLRKGHTISASMIDVDNTTAMIAERHNWARPKRSRSGMRTSRAVAGTPDEYGPTGRVGSSTALPRSTSASSILP